MRGAIPINEIEQYLPILRSLNDTVRFVDPVKKRIINLQGDRFVETNEYCFERWCSKSLCDNCVSAHAHHQNCSVIKIVNSSGLIFMITAIPIVKSDNPLVIELLNNITDSLFFGSASGSNAHQNLDAILALNDIAIKDQLTSLYNRRFVDKRLPIDIQNASTGNYPITILFIDIDDFKNINDKFGHDMGDIALQEAADVFRNVVRAEIDWVARYGGDEFLICLNHADENTARIIAEHISLNTEKISIPVDEGILHFTVSIGVHTMRRKLCSAAEAIKIADKNMYKSKSKGKNTITISAD